MNHSTEDQHSFTDTEVLVLMGSTSDLTIMEPAAQVLEDADVTHCVCVASAHREPARVQAIVEAANRDGVKVIIAGAGLAAHLPGVVTSHTDVPVIGVPIAAGTLGGFDSVFSILQMPAGVPVATVGINNAKNAALLALQILRVHARTGASSVGTREANQDHNVLTGGAIA